MPSFLRNKLGLLTVFAMVTGAEAADNLPPLRVDPALLVPPPPVQPSANVPTASTPAPSSTGPNTAAPAMPAGGGTPAQSPAAPASGAGQNPSPPSPAAPAGGGARAEPETGAAPQTSAFGPLPDAKLRITRALLPPPGDKDRPLPSFLTADSITGTTDVDMHAKGSAELRRYGTSIAGDSLVRHEDTDVVEATGHVHVRRDQDEISGPYMKLNMETNEGYFETPDYSITHAPKIVAGTADTAVADTSIPASTGTGSAQRLDFEGKDKYKLAKATYTTCPAGSPPDWFARAADMNLDYVENKGVAHDMTIVFENTPILYSPWASFSLNNQRQSGFLAPGAGSTSRGGLEFTVPYYWNIAPQMDATVGVREMAKRGDQLQGEYRYLGEGYAGQIDTEYLEHDKVLGFRRDSLSMVHAQDFGEGFSGSLNVRHVSDDSYYTDLSDRITDVSAIYLLRQGNLAYNAGWWNVNVMAQSYQTLQFADTPFNPVPYNRLPDATLYANRPDMPFGTTFTMQGEYVDFSNPTGVVEGRRTTLYPQLSLPYQTAAFYVTPKIGISTTHYELENPGTIVLPDGAAAQVPDKQSRTLPIFSIDSGVTFERDTDWFGRDVTQTLEPRVYYLRVPYRNQDLTPVFDTGLADFNFGQIFSENIYSGGDRISEANQVTTALTSRLINPLNGSELIKGAIGQRYYFSKDRVTLPGVVTPTGRISDFLAALTGKLTQDVSGDAGLEYNVHDDRLQRYTLTGRYQPEFGAVLSGGFLYTRDLENQVDIAVQWPIRGGWSAVGRYAYAISNKRLAEGVAGLEYNAGCWIARVVVHSLATPTGSPNNYLFFQLELTGFSQIGSNPLDILKRNIPGFSRLNLPATNREFSPDQNP